MNLIMSDVEETIMIVDPDGATNGQGVVNVSQLYFDTGHISYTFTSLGRETKNGNAICERGQCNPCSFNTAIAIFSADELISRCRPQQEHNQQLRFLIA